MSNSILSKLTSEELLALFRKEAKIGAAGSVEFTRRGVSRLTGKDKVQIHRLLVKCSGDKKNGFTPSQNIPKTLKPFAGFVFNSGDNLPDNVVNAIIRHYDKECDERCSDLIDLLGSVGLRQSVHIAQNWETNQSPTDSIAYRYLLPEPRTWDKQFPDAFYHELERLTMFD